MAGKNKKNILTFILVTTVLIIIINGIFFLQGIIKFFEPFSLFSKKKIFFEINEIKSDKKDEVMVSKKTAPLFREKETPAKERIKSKKVSKQGKAGSSSVVPEGEKKLKPPLQKKKKEAGRKKVLLQEKEAISKKQNSFLLETKKTPKKKEIKILILDDFDNNRLTNNLGGSSKSFWERRGVCINSFYYEADIPNTYYDRKGEYSLRLAYDVSEVNSISGFITDLNDVNLKGCQYLSFWVKGAEGKEVFKVRLDDGIKTSEVSIKEFLPDGLFPAWRRVVIPLEMFKAISNWENIRGGVGIIFDYKEGSVRQGVIYIDEIVFE